MSSSYRMELDKWLSQLDVKADRVLDIGGAQEPLKGRTNSWDVKEYLIADLANPHKDSPKPDIIMDLNESPIFSDEAILGGEKVTYIRFEKEIMRSDSCDQIFCLEVFDYIWNPANAMVIISSLLKNNGTAWVSFPSVYPLHQPIEDDALRYMPGGIKKLADSVGLEIVQMIKRRPETNGWQKFVADERMRAAKHEDHAFTGFIVEFRK